MNLTPWTIEITDLETESRVGIWPHELRPQPVRISLTLRAMTSTFPATIHDCLNYEPLCKWICGTWSEMAHTPLLETRVRELTDFIFLYDARIDWATVKIIKVKAVPQTAAVGISVAMSRLEHAASFGMRSVPLATRCATTGIDHVQHADC